MEEKPAPRPSEPPPAAEDPKAESDPAKEQERQILRIVRARWGDNLWGIAERTYGECDTGILNQVKRANPDIEDVDKIALGQLIRLPRLEKTGR